jgi:hypothetical protein
MTTIIITECQNPYGKFWLFRDKQTGRKYAEVDRFEKGYKIYSGEWLSEVGRRTNKDSAIEFAKRCIREQIAEVEFKWNVITIKERWLK